MNSLPVLTARRAVQVDDHFQAMVTRPSNGLLEVGELALDVGLPGANLECPVANWNADVVESEAMHGRECKLGLL